MGWCLFILMAEYPSFRPVLGSIGSGITSEKQAGAQRCRVESLKEPEWEQSRRASLDSVSHSLGLSSVGGTSWNPGCSQREQEVLHPCLSAELVHFLPGQKLTWGGPNVLLSLTLRRCTDQLNAVPLQLPCVKTELSY